MRALEGGFPELGAHHPRPPDAVGGGDGSRPRRRRLADPRLRARCRRTEVAPLTAAFYFDLASPLAYLAAERALGELRGRAEPVEWIPVRAALPGGETFEALRCRTEPRSSARRSSGAPRELGLQPLRWPEPFPFDSTLAMRVATYAKSIGRAVPFAQAAFRQAFAGGRSLAEEDYVLIAAAACEMHPAAVLQGAGLRSVAERARDGHRAARAGGAQASRRYGARRR